MPTVTVDPNPAHPGEIIQITTEGFSPPCDIQVLVDGEIVQAKEDTDEPISDDFPVGPEHAGKSIVVRVSDDTNSRDVVVYVN